MFMRHSRVWCLIVVVAAAGWIGFGGSLQAEERPNVILVLTDDQGFGDVGIHGNPQIKTPTIDQFAQRGVRCDRFYCSPVCAPTRAAILTGRSAYRTGVIHTSRGGAKMHGDETTLAEILRDAGYQTGIFGKWHLGDNFPMRPQDQGFVHSLVHKSGGIGQTPDHPNDYFDPLLWQNGHAIKTEGYCTDIFFDAAIDFIDQHRQSPFFVYLPTNAPHTPLTVPSEYLEPYTEMGLEETTARIYAMMTNIDDNLARLLAKLDEWKLRDNTLVIFMSDNGPQQRRYTAGLRGRKGSVYEGGIRVPFFVQWPAKLSGQQRSDYPLADIDLLPTVVEACQADWQPTRQVDGQSFLPLLTGQLKRDEMPRRNLFFQVHRGLSPQKYRNATAIGPRYKLVINPGAFNQEGPDDTPTQWELYDITQDPGEQTDLADQLPEEVAALRKSYEQWFDSVSAERQFEPGRIVIGSESETPTLLCRYQDAHWEEGEPRGWDVKLLRGGTFEIRTSQPLLDDEEVHVRWQGTTHRLAPDQPTGQVQLEAGEGRLAVWLQTPEGQPRLITDNSPLGDVLVRRVDE